MKFKVLLTIPLITILTLMVALISCDQQQENLTVTGAIHLKINPNNLPPIAKLSEVVESIKLIPLETRPDCYINAIVRTFVGDDHILVIVLAP